MENVNEFYNWLNKMLDDAKKELNMTDETIAYILLSKGTAYYFRTIEKCGRCPLNLGKSVTDGQALP